MRCINAVLSQESTHEMELVVAIDGDDCGRVSTQLKEAIASTRKANRTIDKTLKIMTKRSI